MPAAGRAALGAWRDGGARYYGLGIPSSIVVETPTKTGISFVLDQSWTDFGAAA